MMATDRSCLRSFWEAEEAHMAASRTVAMTRAMNMALLERVERLLVADGGGGPVVGVVGELADEEAGDVPAGHGRADLVAAEEPRTDSSRGRLVVGAGDAGDRPVELGAGDGVGHAAQLGEGVGKGQPGEQRQELALEGGPVPGVGDAGGGEPDEAAGPRGVHRGDDGAGAVGDRG